MNSKFKRIVIFASVLLLQPMMNPGSLALAKRKTPPKAFSFIAEGGKASQGECDGERKIPRLKRLKEFGNTSSYMGSELQSPEIKGKIDGEMWKHFFRVKASCNTVLAKTPSSVNEALTSAKPDLPEEEDIEDTDAPEQTEGSTESPTDGAAASE
ncbi:hypothetical protein [Bdellovibrio bacteriovorus]|uniref:hypothetical protein n=1 Tax=Bdellovibrio bacteriovorus TaxID=959 RepID=UPI0035A59A5F